MDLSTFEGLLQGGQTGLAVTPGAVATSRLHLLASRQVEPAMPPDPAEALDDAQLQVLADWIQAGAVGPVGARPRPILRVPKIEIQHTRPAPITALALSPDGRVMALGQSGRVVLAEVTDLKSGVSLEELVQHRAQVLSGFSGKVNSLQFSATGTYLAVATGIEGLVGEAHLVEMAKLTSTDRQAEPGAGRREWSIQELAAPVFAGHRDSVYAAVVSPDEKWVATAGYDRVIKLWRTSDAQWMGEFAGHNGAVFDLVFTADSGSLLSASAYQTVKVWDVASQSRADTLGQPEGEVYAVRYLPPSVDESQPRLLAVGADNRLRVWRWLTAGLPVSNPLLETRFVDETPLLAVAIEPAGRWMAIASQAGSLKILSTKTWDVVEVLEPVTGTPSGLAFAPDGHSLWIADLGGQVSTRMVRASDGRETVGATAVVQPPQYLPVAEMHSLSESTAETDDAGIIAVPRQSMVHGTIARPGEIDYYAWEARAHEVWAIDVDPVRPPAEVSSLHPTMPASGEPSDLDPLVTILDDTGQPVLRIRLQAVRESYFTFRGKDSMQTDDFRLFGQQEMRLDQFLYAAGEVTRLWMHPRGPDSGFDMYPGAGQRWTYFGTSHLTHALGEPAYIVQPLAAGQRPLDNGLPTFDIVYRNDDDPSRRAGKGSRVLFTAPADGRYTVAVQDTRLHGGDGFDYQLRIRPAQPSFTASVTPISLGLLRGAGREFTVSVERLDDFAGPIEFTIRGLPPGVSASLPLVIEADQQAAHGTLWINEDLPWPAEAQPEVWATAEIFGQVVTRSAGLLGELRKAETTPVVPWIDDSGAGTPPPASWEEGQPAPGRPEAFATVIQVPRGGTVSARVRIHRGEGLQGEVSFGNALAARNPAHGVFVDNIGLNGLLLLAGMNEREFFLTAEPKTALGPRPFFLKAEIDGGITTVPIWVEVVESLESPTRVEESTTEATRPGAP